MSDSVSISRRTALKGLGLAVGSAAVGVAPSPPAEGASLLPSGRCFIYLDHAARNLSSTSQWVVGALLVGDPRLPRQILRRAKRHRLSLKDRTMPEIKARLPVASTAFKQYFFKQLGTPSKKLLKKKPVLELYSVRASRTVLKVPGKRVGLFQLRMLQALLEVCGPGRFREVFVYHNLPSLRGVSEKALNAGLSRGVRLWPGTKLKTWEHPPVRRTGTTQDLLVDEGIQVADFATYAFYQKYQHGNARWFNMIRPRVRWEINALALLPSFLISR